MAWGLGKAMTISPALDCNGNTSLQKVRRWATSLTSNPLLVSTTTCEATTVALGWVMTRLTEI